MDSQSSDEIAEEWVLAWSGKEPPSVGAVIGAPRLDWELPQEDPGLCLESIVKVLGRIDRLLLNGVWDSTIKPEVLSKLAKYRDQRW